MSTYWGYKCIDHDNISEHWLNYGEDQLRLIWDNREVFVKLYELQENKNWVYQLHMANDPGISMWLSDHKDCKNVVLHNEYNDITSIFLEKEITIFDKMGFPEARFSDDTNKIIFYIEKLENKQIELDRLLRVANERLSKLEKT